MVPGALILVLVAALALYGAVPGLAAPALAQALWSTGFAQSFVNDSLFSVYAANFGAPQPAAIAFGLAGAWPMALFIACGLHPVDAYSAAAALWLSVAGLSAYRLARMFEVARPLAIGGAALWLTMPIVWAHAGYSMVSFGIALLPFYFLCALLVFSREPGFSIGLLYLAACLVAVFMDGYSFVMFAAGSSLLGAWLFLRSPARRRTLLRWALPVHLAGLALSAALYVLYVGGEYQRAPLEAFRAWGLDLAFLAVPTQGVHWIPDALGLSTPRSEERFFGDWSVWRTTFALPLLAAALWAWWKTRRTSVLATGLLVVMLGGLYMALGPSLKINATKPAGQESSYLVPANAGLAATGSGWLSSTVPGLRNMRSAYRWLALAVFSGWLLLILLLAAKKRADLLLAAALAAGVALLNLPEPRQRWRENVQNRDMFLRIDAELVDGMRAHLKARERVAFLPYGNDFLANYLAARLDIVSYNIGGDKNLETARRHWPETMRELREASVDEGFAGHVMLLLARAEADSVVLPYFDLRWAAHAWPAALEHQDRLRPAMSTMRASNFVNLVERDHYAVVRLNPQVPESAVLQRFCAPPLCLREELQGGAPAGPRPMAAGRYRFVVRGSAATREAWVELVSGPSGVRHARFALSGGPVLVDGLVTLQWRVEDLALRVVAADGAAVRIDGYELVPARPARR